MKDNDKPTNKERVRRIPASQDPIEGEVWRAVPGHEGFYEASTEGRIRSRFGIGSTKGRKKAMRQDSWYILKPLLQKAGYDAVCIYKPGAKVKLVKVHRLVALTFLGPSELVVNHKDGSKTNNRVSNLEWVTLSQNGLHSMRVLKNKPMVNNKLTPQDVEQIREYLRQGLLQREIAEIYGVRQTTISHIAVGKSWGSKTMAHVQNDTANFRTQAYEGDEGAMMGVGY